MVDPELEARLYEASMDRLLEWSRNVLAATTLEEVFAERGSADGRTELEP